MPVCTFTMCDAEFDINTRTRPDWNPNGNGIDDNVHINTESLGS